MSFSVVRRCLHNPRRVTVISPARGRRPRPGRPRVEPGGPQSCPFCPGNEASTPPAVLTVRLSADGSPMVFLGERESGSVKDWVVRVIPNKFPVFSPEGSQEGHVYGYHEVLIESRVHSEDEYLKNPGMVYMALVALKERVRQIIGDQRVKYVAVFKNSGVEAGATISHPHMQIIGSSFVPPEIEDEYRWFNYRVASGGACPLCAPNIPVDLVVYSNRSFIVSVAYAPRAPFETLIIPKRHAPNFLDLSDHETFDLADALSKTLRALGAALGGLSYNFWVHAQFDASDQSYHWHIEVLPATTTWAGYEKGFGVYVVDRMPEDMADELRRIMGSIG